MPCLADFGEEDLSGDGAQTHTQRRRGSRDAALPRQVQRAARRSAVGCVRPPREHGDMGISGH